MNLLPQLLDLVLQNNFTLGQFFDPRPKRFAVQCSALKRSLPRQAQTILPAMPALPIQTIALGLYNQELSHFALDFPDLLGIPYDLLLLLLLEQCKLVAVLLQRLPFFQQARALEALLAELLRDQLMLLS